MTAIRLLLLALLVTFLLGGCDVQTDVKVTSGGQETEKLATLVRQLDAEAVEQRERADRLQAELDELQQTNVVTAGDKQVTFRLNTSAAVVLVFAIVALAAYFIARLKYAPDA